MSWIFVAEDSIFPLQSLPFGVFSTAIDPNKRIGVALGSYVVDISVLKEGGLFDGLGFDVTVLGESELNSFMALNRDCWRQTRSRLTNLLAVDGRDDRLRNNQELQRRAIIPSAEAIMHLPARIGDYTGTDCW
jgi:fumarylacetoacetase